MVPSAQPAPLVALLARFSPSRCHHAQSFHALISALSVGEEAEQRHDEPHPRSDRKLHLSSIPCPTPFLTADPQSSGAPRQGETPAQQRAERPPHCSPRWGRQQAGGTKDVSSSRDPTQLLSEQTPRVEPSPAEHRGARGAPAAPTRTSPLAVGQPTFGKGKQEKNE